MDGLCLTAPSPTSPNAPIAESPPPASCDCVDCDCDPCECPAKASAASPRVILYSPATAYCQPCEQTKVWLRSNGIAFTEVKTSRYNRFPRIEIDEDVIHGYDVVALAAKLGVKRSAAPTAFASVEQGRPVFRNVVYGSPVRSASSCATCRR